MLKVEIKNNKCWLGSAQYEGWEYKVDNKGYLLLTVGSGPADDKKIDKVIMASAWAIIYDGSTASGNGTWTEESSTQKEKDNGKES